MISFSFGTIKIQKNKSIFIPIHCNWIFVSNKPFIFIKTMINISVDRFIYFVVIILCRWFEIIGVWFNVILHICIHYQKSSKSIWIFFLCVTFLMSISLYRSLSGSGCEKTFLIFFIFSSGMLDVFDMITI